MNYVYSIAINAASGRLKLKSLADPGPILGLKYAAGAEIPLSDGVLNQAVLKGMDCARGKFIPGIERGRGLAHIEGLVLNDYVCLEISGCGRRGSSDVPGGAF